MSEVAMKQIDIKRGEEPEYLSLKDAARLSGINHHAIRVHAKAGRFPVYRLRRKIYVNFSEFRDWIRSCGR
jgi:hypothetical protein